jgi:hypothetical protein
VPDLHARKLAVHVPACETGQHVMHPTETCEEYEAFSAHVRAFFADTFAEADRLLIHGNGTGEPRGILATPPPREPTPLERALDILDAELRACPLYDAGPPGLRGPNWKARQ